MIISDISYDKKNKNYKISIDNNIYTFSEDIMVEYNIYKGKEIDKEFLNKAIESEEINDYYQKALNYSIRYFKGKTETKRYLLDKGLNVNDANKIIEKLEEKGIINDNKIIESLIYSYIKAGSGRYKIINKLKEKGFNEKDINQGMLNMDFDLYNESLNKMYNKAIKKYEKENDSYIRKNKIKAYLINHGFGIDEINDLE